jgi:chemotaxis protein MotB
MTHANPAKKKKHHEEEHENHERWLVSYADMVTLLMCLFIVLFAISQVDTKKFNALSNGLSEGFGAPMSILDDGVNAENAAVTTVNPPPVQLRKDAAIGNGAGQKDPRVEEIEDALELERQEQLRRNAKTAYDDLDAVRRSIDAALRRAGYANATRYQINERGLVVSITTDRVLFDSARADLKPAGLAILNAIAPALRTSGHRMAIEGHTNQLPLLPGTQWPSDWELSAYRATSVLRHLADVGRLDEANMYAAGFADTRPLIDPSRPSSVVRNRRVDVVVLSDAPSDVNALLPRLDASRVTK